MCCLKKLGSVLIPTITFLALAGCSGDSSPSAAEVQTAIQNMMLDDAEIGMAPKDIEVHDVKVFDCVAGDNDPSHICNVEYSMTWNHELAQPQTLSLSDTMRFIKGSDGWINRD